MSVREPTPLPRELHDRRRRGRTGVGSFLLVLLALCLLGTDPLAAQYLSRTDWIGGTGSTASDFARACPHGQVLVGIRGKSGWWIDALQGICQRVNRDGRWITQQGRPGQQTEYTSRAGGSGSFNFTRQCPRDYVLKGFGGWSGSYVDRISLYCYKLGRSALAEGTTYNLPEAGGSGGERRGRARCASDMPARGFYGKAGIYIDRFGLQCGRLVPAPVRLTQPTEGETVTSRTPAFSWWHEDHLASRNEVVLRAYGRADRRGTVQASPCSVSLRVSRALYVTSFIPREPLPCDGGQSIFWKVRACNDNGCTESPQSRFWFSPPTASR